MVIAAIVVLVVPLLVGVLVISFLIYISLCLISISWGGSMDGMVTFDMVLCNTEVLETVTFLRDTMTQF